MPLEQKLATLNQRWEMHDIVDVIKKINLLTKK